MDRHISGDTGRYSEGERRRSHDVIREQARSSKHSIEQFQSTFKTDIAVFEPDEMVPYQRDIMASANIKSGWTVTSYDKIGKGLYDNIIDVEGGKIIGVSNDKNNTKDWYFSDIIYNQILLVLKQAGKSISEFDLKSWYGYSISNADTKKVALECIQGGHKRTFKNGSEEFERLIQTSTGRSKKFLLEGNPEAFPGKRVTSITVIRHPRGRIDIEYEIGS